MLSYRVLLFAPCRSLAFAVGCAGDVGETFGWTPFSWLRNSSNASHSDNSANSNNNNSNNDEEDEDADDNGGDGDGGCGGDEDDEDGDDDTTALNVAW